MAAKKAKAKSVSKKKKTKVPPPTPCTAMKDKELENAVKALTDETVHFSLRLCSTKARVIVWLTKIGGAPSELINQVFPPPNPVPPKNIASANDPPPTRPSMILVRNGADAMRNSMSPILMHSYPYLRYFRTRCLNCA